MERESTTPNGMINVDDFSRLTMLDILRAKYPGYDFTEEFDQFHNKQRVTVWSNVLRENRVRTFEYDIWRDNVDNLIVDIDNYLYVGGNARLSRVIDVVNNLKPDEPKPHHCVCCGAPIPRGREICEYCGVEYY